MTSAVGLEGSQVDVSEIVGGAEAPVKTYSGLSEQDLDDLHRVIQQKEFALKELDRFLHAAQTFGRKTKKNWRRKGAAKQWRTDWWRSSRRSHLLSSDMMS